MEPKTVHFKKHLSASGLLAIARESFAKIHDPIQHSPYSLVDCLISGLALFGLKYSSLLQFDNDMRGVDEIKKHNLHTLYGVKQAPCDTTMRERLDEVKPNGLQIVMNKIVAQLQRGKAWETYTYLDNYYLVAIDGSGYFSSNEIHCSSCCEKHHNDGTVTYYHQMLVAVMVHPDYRTVFPLALEPIIKEDGKTKNDCEHNAAKRLIKNLRNSHPHLKIIVLLDALYADGPMIRLLKEHDLRFIITAKDSDLKYLFECYKDRKKEEIVELGAKGKESHYLWANNLPLNDANNGMEVNLFELYEKDKKMQHFCRITDLVAGANNVKALSRGGRARWHVENETFNTLKNHGYEFGHNFGHGYKHLTTVMAYLMFTAFLIDQIQEFCCKYFKAALERCGSRMRVWSKMSGLFLHFLLNSWQETYNAITYGIKGRSVEIFDTS